MKIILAGTILFFGCCNSAKQPAANVPSADSYTHAENKAPAPDSIDFSVSPVLIIYKTKNDYYDKVPVTLNDEKTKIISYPGIKDVFYKGKLALPSRLNEGYLLDNRGINKNVAFLNMTYEQYSKRNDVPLLSEMMKMITDKNPLTEMYNCGSRYQYKEEVRELNTYIDGKKLNKFQKIL